MRPNEHPEMKEKLKINQGETLALVKSKSEGFMAETDVDEYEIVNTSGEIVGSVVYKNHTAVKGFRVTQSVIQKDVNGKTIVDIRW